MKTRNEDGAMTVRDLIDMLSEYDSNAYVTISVIMHPVGVQERNGYVNIQTKYSNQIHNKG